MKLNFTHHKALQLNIILVLLFCFNSLWSQCPTIVNSNQIFCDSDLATVASLQAQNNGGGIVWFSSPNSIVPLGNFQPLQNGAVYYADDNNNSCNIRQSVTVTILSAPIGPNFQGFCVQDISEATVSNLIVIGIGIQWFTTPFGGTALDPNTVLTSGSIYFASQTNPQTGCLSSRLPVFVTIGFVQAPTGDASQSICFDDPNDPPTVSDLVASGENNWYISENATIPLSPLTPLVNGQTYYATTTTPPCESEERLAVTVTLLSANDAGVSSSINYCESLITNGGSFNLVDLLGGTPSTTGTWAGDLPTLNGGLGTVNFSQLSLLNSPFEFTYTVQDNNLCPIATSTVQITIDELFTPGNDFDFTICSNEAPIDLFNLIPGNPSPNGVWNPPLSSGSNIFNPAIDLSGIYTYSVNIGTSCPVLSSSVLVTVTDTPDAGESNTTTICDNIGTFELTSLLLGTPELNGTWSPPLASGTNIFDPMVDTSGVYTYTILSNSTCPDSFAVLNLTVENAAYAGEDAIVEICDNDAPFDLRTLLGGNPDLNGFWTPALASANNTFIPLLDLPGVYTYTVIGNASCGDDSATIQMTISEAPNAGVSSNIIVCFNDLPINLFENLSGTPEIGGVWTPNLTNPGFFDPTQDTPGIYTYTVIGDGSCEDAQANVNVQIEPNPNAGNDTVITICESDAPFDLLGVMDGNPDAGGFWTPALSSGNNIFNPQIDQAGAYTYTVSGILNCIDDTSQIIVNINSVLNAGADNQIVVCSTDAPVNLFEALNGNPDLGGFWQPALTNDGFFDPDLDTPGLYTYTISGNGICPDVSASVLVDVVLPPNAGDDNAISVCSIETPFDLNNLLGGNQDENGVWTPALSSGNSIFNPQLDNAGIYTYTVTANNSCGQDQSQVIVEVIQTPNSGQETTITICEGNAPISLTDALLGNPDLNGTWTPALASGTDVFDPSVDTAGSYWYVVQGTFPCDNTATSLFIVIEPELNAGLDNSISLCTSDTPINLFNLLGGNPQEGGVWSPTLASGSGIFDPSIDPAGDYTYTIIGNLFCEDDDATITVTLDEQPNAGTSTTINVCENEAPINLLTLLGANVDTNGSWSPSLQSNSNIFDPSTDSAGLYTYTVAGLGVCDEATSTILIQIDQPASAGISSQITVCSDSAPVNLFNALQGSPDNGGTWSPALTSNSGVFNPALDAPGVYTYSIAANGACPAASATVDVSIENQSDPGVSVSVELCESSNSIDLFDVLGGNPDNGGIWSPALASGNSIFNPALDNQGVYTYTFPSTQFCTQVFSTVTISIVPNPDAGGNATLEICENDAPVNLFSVLNGTPDAGGVWSPPLASGSGVFNPSVDAGGLYTYTINSNQFCASASSTVLVNLIPTQSAGQDGQTTICQDDPSFDLTTLLGGNPILSGSWSPELSSGTDIFNPLLDGSGVYTYSVTTPCGTDTAQVTVTIELIPQAGTNASVVVCSNGAAINLFNILGGNPQLGGNWSPALLSGNGIFNPLLDLPGVYTYTVGGSPSCGERSATVTVTLEQPLNPGVSNSITICQNSSNINLFNLLGNTAAAGGTWSPALASGTNFYNPQADGAGVFTYTVGGTLNCNPSQATVTVNFIPAISSGVFEGVQQVCISETTFDLFSLLDGSQTLGGIWLNGSGNIISNIINPSLLATGTYPFVYLISNSCLSTSTVTQLQIVPNPSLSQNNVGIDTPICIGESVSILISSIPDGNYQLGIEGLGSNIFAEVSFELIVANGFGIITIPSTFVPNPGQTIFQFNNILNTLTGCSSNISNVSATLEILPAPSLLPSQVTIDDICLGENLVITIQDALQLGNANYIIQYEVTGPDTFISESGTILIENGQSSFSIDAALLTQVGNFNFSVLQILNTTTGCLGAVNVTTPFTIHSLPVTIQPIIILENPLQCVNESNVVTIDFGLGLPDNDYEISYTLSGAITFSQTVTVPVTDGIATLNLPETLLNIGGIVTIDLVGFDFFENLCGISSVLNATQTFEIEAVTPPSLIAEIPTFCEEDSPTISLLSDFVNSNGNTLVWYDAPNAGSIVNNQTVLLNGFTYYAAAISANGCESLERLEVTTIVETCIVDILIPDGFSPNNDSVNDNFEIVNIRDLYPNFTIEIYNRYGNIVFKGNASTNDWDGHNSQGGVKLNNSVLPNGVYFYIINFNDGITKAKQGRVYLNR